MGFSRRIFFNNRNTTFSSVFHAKFKSPSRVETVLLFFFSLFSPLPFDLPILYKYHYNIMIFCIAKNSRSTSINVLRRRVKIDPLPRRSFFTRSNISMWTNICLACYFSLGKPFHPRIPSRLDFVSKERWLNECIYIVIRNCRNWLINYFSIRNYRS